MKLVLTTEMFEQVRQLYEDMETAYDQVAAALNLSCDRCPDNCCDSYFSHHTYIEWLYLWAGVRQLPPETQKSLFDKARHYDQQSTLSLAEGKRPRLMCPLNEAGRCLLYSYRLMVCRTHGVPASMTRPDGRRLQFPGCFRCQEIVEQKYGKKDQLPVMERTALLQRLAALEQQLIGGRRHLMPRLKLTIAQMLIKGPPEIAGCIKQEI